MFNQKWANLKSQSYIKISNLLFSNPKYPKSKPQIPILKLKIPIKSQCFHKYINMNYDLYNRRELAICLSVSLSVLLDSVS